MGRIFLLASLLFIGHGTAGATDYFQQEVHYRIDVVLSDHEHFIEGNIAITYVNHAPDALSEIYMHHWPNAYSSPESPLARQLLKSGDFDFQFSSTDNMGRIDGISYTIDGVSVTYDITSTPVDYVRIPLPQPLLPGDSIVIETPFRVDFPDASISRLGHDGQAYFATQWYPKPAVYDADGWHPMSYLNQGEFYSEFGSFDVRITVPANYVVMATGTLQNAAERDWLLSLDEYTRKQKQFSENMDFPPSEEVQKTLRYTASDVHDFAWFADKRYNVLYDEFVTAHSGDTVEVWSAFTNNEADLWRESTNYIKDALKHYSEWVGEYPYPHATAVDGTISAGGGMEYPMITIIGESGNAVALETVIMHEVGHNWFYGILANDERQYPWLDEGLNSALEQRYLETKYPELNVLSDFESNPLLDVLRAGDMKHRDQYRLAYQWAARHHGDQPIATHSVDFTPLNYGIIAYGKSALVLNYLRAYMGDEAYDTMMHEYYAAHRFKHPKPQHFLGYVDRALKGNTAWFRDLINTTEKADFKVSGLKKAEAGYELRVKSKGGIKGPVAYQVLGARDTILESGWIAPFAKKSSVFIRSADFDAVVLDGDRRSPDINLKNNRIRRTGLLRKMEKLRLQPLVGLEEANRTTLYYSPLLGYNTTDQVMAGILLHNQNVFQKQIEFRVSPMYGFGSQRFNWMAAVRYNFRFQDSRWIENLWFEGNTASFSTGGIPDRGYFVKGQLVGNLDFKRKPLNRNLSHHLFSTLTAVQERFPLPGDAADNTLENVYGQIVYMVQNDYALRPYQLRLGTDIHADFDRFWFEANGKFVINARKRSLKWRFFAGAFSYNNTDLARYNFRMDGIGGNEDFRYDHIFLGRFESEGITAQQFASGHGNFKIPTANGQSNEWLTALNLKFEAPFNIPIGLFADIGFSAAGSGQVSDLLYTTGIYAWLIPGAVEVYFPIPVGPFTAEDIRNEIDVRGLNYAELIRFMVNFNEINPLNLMRSIGR